MFKLCINVTLKLGCFLVCQCDNYVATTFSQVSEKRVLNNIRNLLFTCMFEQVNT